MRTVGDLGEFRLIERIARILPAAPTVVGAIGDDCAVVRLHEHVLLLSSDLCIENEHFRLSALRPEEIGWKAAAGAISDIAAMGGTPSFSLVSLACRQTTPVTFVEDIYRGMSNVFSQYGGVIVGGDTSSTDGPITIDVAVVGEVRGDRCLRRKGAMPGDLLAVTGLPGLSAAGLHAIEHDKDDPELTQRHRWPRPRIREGQWLCDHREIHAMLDTSDGLVQDSGHLAEAGELGVDIDPGLVPLSPILTRHCEEFGLDPLEFALCGGEDYELAFALAADRHDQTLEAMHHEFRTLVTVIGRFTDEWSGVRVDGKALERGGFDHFASNPRP